MLGADTCQEKVSVPGQSSSICNRLPQDFGCLLVSKLLIRVGEQHQEDHSGKDGGEQEENIAVPGMDLAALSEPIHQISSEFATGVLLYMRSATQRWATLYIMMGIYSGIALATCFLAIVGWVILRRRSADQADANTKLLDAIIERQSPRPRPSPAKAPNVRRPARVVTQLSMLENHLRNASFDPRARERLVKDAMQTTHGDRTAATQKVLHDLEAEDRRWS